jgi:hypothetical protein
MDLIKIKKGYTNKIGQYIIMLDVYCYMNDIVLSKTEKKILSYLIAYGCTEKTFELLRKSEMLDGGSLRNTMSKFRKHGFLKKHNKKDVLTDAFNIKLEKEFAILIKVSFEGTLQTETNE